MSSSRPTYSALEVSHFMHCLFWFTTYWLTDTAFVMRWVYGLWTRYNLAAGQCMKSIEPNTEMTTCAPYHVRTTALETEALALSAREFGTVCRAAYGHWTSATNILRRCWRHICFDKATALCDILYKRLRNILTYLLTYLLYGRTTFTTIHQECYVVYKIS